MVTTLSDTFTDTEGISLSLHSPDVGSAWEAMAYGVTGVALGTDLQIMSNRCSAPNLSDGGSSYRNSTDPGSDEYDISATFQFRTTLQTNRWLALAWRMTPTGTASIDVNRYLLLGDNGADQQWKLYKAVGGVFTLLDSAVDVLAGNSFAVVVEVRNGSMEVFLDGSGISIVSSTDTEITQRGRVGVGIRRGDIDHWLDNFFVDSVVGGVMEPILVGDGTHADRIMAGLISQGFTTGTIVDREYARLLAKLILVAPQPYSLDDLYSLANEDNRILGLYGAALPA